MRLLLLVLMIALLPLRAGVGNKVTILQY